MGVNVVRGAFPRSNEQCTVTIRGQVLDLDLLINPKIDNPDFVERCRADFAKAQPFSHLVLDGLFNEELLALALEDFPASGGKMRRYVSAHESFLRSTDHLALGPAVQLYFDLTHRHRFVQFLSAVTGIDNLITDHSLCYGGMHETANGGTFGIHRDFNFHRNTMLANELVLLTYLNRDWQPEYGGVLELWDAATRMSAAQVEPLFGRTLIMRHSKISFHGHPKPLNFPEGMSRKSLATYYYTNPHARHDDHRYRSSLFLADVKGSAIPRAGDDDPIIHVPLGRRVKRVLRRLTPPFVWEAGRRIKHRRPAA